MKEKSLEKIFESLNRDFPEITKRREDLYDDFAFQATNAVVIVAKSMANNYGITSAAFNIDKDDQAVRQVMRDLAKHFFDQYNVKIPDSGIKYKKDAAK